MISFVFLDESFGKKRHPKPIDYEDLPVPLIGVTVPTPSKVRKCVGALVRFESGPFRVRHDGGGVPVSSALIATASGYSRNDGDEYFFSREEITQLCIVLDTLGPLIATQGILRVTYYG